MSRGAGHRTQKTRDRRGTGGARSRSRARRPSRPVILKRREGSRCPNRKWFRMLGLRSAHDPPSIHVQGGGSCLLSPVYRPYPMHSANALNGLPCDSLTGSQVMFPP